MQYAVWANLGLASVPHPTGRTNENGVMVAKKREHLLRRSRALDPVFQTVLRENWRAGWPNLQKDSAWDDELLDAVSATLEIYELAQWAVDTPTIILDGRTPGRLCSADSDMRAAVRAKIMALTVTKRKKLESEMKKIGMPNVLAPGFTTALGRWLIKYVELMAGK